MPSASQREEAFKYIAHAMAKAPSVALKIGWRYLKVKKRAQRAEKLFRKRLEASGIDRETAVKLADRYASTASIRHMLQTFGMPKRIFNGHDD